MQKSFNSIGFIKELAQELVSQFDKAGAGVTPVTVGTARENAVREKLRQILPGNIGVGTGFVIDSFGTTSKQTDIVIFEKDICPVFSINNTPETTFYPCESVIAVGEIKSLLDSSDLNDSFGKIESVKRCRRYVENTINWRKYFNTITTLGAESERFNQTMNPKDQIYGFILCESLGLTIETFLEKCKREMNSRANYLCPDIIVPLKDGVALPVSLAHKHFSLDQYDSDTFYFSNKKDNFQFFLSRLYEVMSVGRTSSILPFNRYVIQNAGQLELDGQGISL